MKSLHAESLDSIQFGAARSDLARLCSRVEFGSERIVVTRHGRPAVALVPISDLDNLQAVEPGRVRAEAEASFARPVGEVWEALFDSAKHVWDRKFRFQPFIGAAMYNYDNDAGIEFPGEVLDIVDRRLLRFDWPGRCGEVEIRLWATDSGTDVSVVHRMDPEFWDDVLKRWREYVEERFHRCA